MSATVSQYPYTIGQLGVEACLAASGTRALCIWRETWDDSMELATSARRYVLEQRAAATA